MLTDGLPTCAAAMKEADVVWVVAAAGGISEKWGKV